MYPPPSRLILFKYKHKAIKGHRCRQPAKVIWAYIDGGAEFIFILLTYHGGEAVPGNHQIMFVHFQLIEIGYIGVELQINTELIATIV